MVTRRVLVAMGRRGRIAGPQRSRTLVVRDTFTQGASSVLISNHVPDQVVAGQSTLPWAYNAAPASPVQPQLGGTAFPTNQQNQLYNPSSSTSRSAAYITIDPATADYRVTGILRMVGTTSGGNNAYVACRMQATADTFYGASIGINPTGWTGGTPSWQVLLIKHVAGTETILSTVQLGPAPAAASGGTWQIVLDASNNGKVVYVQHLTPGTAWKGAWNAATAYAVGDRVFSAGVGYERLVAGTTATAPAGDPTNWVAVPSIDSNGLLIGYSSFPVRATSSADNTINAPGFAGIYMLRCGPSSGQHYTLFQFETNGPQAQSGTSPAPSPDPVQSPALLWEPDYSVATQTLSTGQPASPTSGLVLGQIWRTEQAPYVRGALQPSRMQVVTGASIPGAGGDPYKPADGAMRVELRPISTVSDFTVRVTVAALATDTTLTMSSADAARLAFVDKGDFMTNTATGEVLRVSAVPSGTSVQVLRGQATTAQPIATTDTLTVHTGDVSDSGSTYETNRAEVYDRFPSGGGGTAPASWPDPVGSVRWYGVSYFIPVGFDTTSFTPGSSWLTLDQWKGQFGGSPPRSLGIDVSRGTNGQWILDGTSPRSRLYLNFVRPGQWTRFVFGFRWDASAVNGWTMVYQDGQLVVPKRNEATMDIHSGAADPIYYKNGIYRTKAWNATHVIHIGPPKVGATMADVVNA
jgi:hypothetical protein